MNIKQAINKLTEDERKEHLQIMMEIEDDFKHVTDSQLKVKLISVQAFINLIHPED